MFCKKPRNADVPFRNIVFLILATTVLLPATATAGPSFTTTITVDTTTDPKPGENDTCTFAGPLGIGPDVDGLCSFRRALVEASLRPTGDRPLLFQFNLPPGVDNTTVADTWTITLNSGNPL
jgi:hypothetical protein